MTTKQENEALKLVNKVLMQALDDSVKLQAHYAKLLNVHDGGKRLVFESAQAWITRLNVIDAQRAERAPKGQRKTEAAS